LANRVEVSIYTPAGYDGKSLSELLIVFDGSQYGASTSSTLVPTPIILDNLIADKKIASTIAVLVSSKNRNRDLAVNPLSLISSLPNSCHGCVETTG